MGGRRDKTFLAMLPRGQGCKGMPLQESFKINFSEVASRLHSHSCFAQCKKNYTINASEWSLRMEWSL